MQRGDFIPNETFCRSHCVYVVLEDLHDGTERIDCWMNTWKKTSDDASTTNRCWRINGLPKIIKRKVRDGEV